jgi:hypothetical protein
MYAALFDKRFNKIYYSSYYKNRFSNQILTCPKINDIIRYQI